MQIFRKYHKNLKRIYHFQKNTYVRSKVKIKFIVFFSNCVAFSEKLNFRLPWNLIFEAFFLSDSFSSVEIDDFSLHRYVIFYTNIKFLFFKTVELFKESDSNPFWIPNLEFGIGCNLISWTELLKHIACPISEVKW